MKKAYFSVVVLSGLVALLLVTVPYVRAQTVNFWVEKAAMPTARSGFGVAVVDGKIYALGGWNKSQTDFLAVNEVYDPATNSWTEKTSMPTHRVSFATVVYDNKIYVIGGQIIGRSGRREIIDVNEVYDPASDTWATKTPMPLVGEDFAANVVVDGKIYVIGAKTDVYDPPTDSWTIKAPIPAPVAHAASAIVDGKIYVFSGNHYMSSLPSHAEPINLTQIYDPETDTWSSGNPIPVSVASAAAVPTSGASAPKAIYIVGGLTIDVDDVSGDITYSAQNRVQVYFPANDSWGMGASMPTARYALSLAAVEDRLFAIGGTDALESPDLTSNELYMPLGYGTIGSQALPQEVVYGVTVVVAVVVIVLVALVLRKHTRR